MQQQVTHNLPQQFYCYKKNFEMLYNSKELFEKLMLEYRICIKCVFRIYAFEHPKIYNDSAFYVEIIPLLLSSFEKNTEEILKEYNVVQCCFEKSCWLCEQILQPSYVNNTVKQIKELIKQKGFLKLNQFKINLRIPTILTLKSVFFIRFIYSQYQKSKVPEKQMKKLFNILIHPLETNRSLDYKIVLKWIVANDIKQKTSMTSTSEDHQDNLVILMEQNYNNKEIEKNILKKFENSLGLEKKVKQRNKRSKYQEEGENKQMPGDIKCTAFNVNKILSLRQKEFQNIFSKLKDKEQVLSILKGNQFQSKITMSNISHTIQLHTQNLYLCGKYTKLSRYLSQTPWLVGDKKITDGSIQQEIQDKIYHLFYPNIPKNKIEIKFHSGGRQDIDVRMLKGGRPFVLEFVDPIKLIKDINEEQVINLLHEKNRSRIRKQVQQWFQTLNPKSSEQAHSKKITKYLEYVVNEDLKYLQVHEFSQTNQSFVSINLKAAQRDKIKHYICYIHSLQQLTEKDKEILESKKVLKIEQLTPIRVLHRRTLMTREKEVFNLKFKQVSKRSGILEVWASAGTYIKEFVHGDLGRTFPNVGSLLNKEIDILQLDVGSLKEGDWMEGDEQIMKMEEFQWMT